MSLCFYVLHSITVIFLWLSWLFMAFAFLCTQMKFSSVERWNDYMPFSAGCPHCKNAVPHFSTAAETFKEDRKVRHHLMKNFPYRFHFLSLLCFFGRRSPSLIAYILPELFSRSCLSMPSNIVMLLFSSPFLGMYDQYHLQCMWIDICFSCVYLQPYYWHCAGILTYKLPTDFNVFHMKPRTLPHSFDFHCLVP